MRYPLVCMWFSLLVYVQQDTSFCYWPNKLIVE